VHTAVGSDKALTLNELSVEVEKSYIDMQPLGFGTTYILILNKKLSANTKLQNVAAHIDKPTDEFFVHPNW
jgi:hypothetical protein